jgi:ATP:ADP antiporter, AAA family
MSLARAEPSDRRTIQLGVFCAGLMIAQQVGSKALRDALFLLHFSPADLPVVMIAGAAVSLGAVWGTTRLTARFGPARVVPLAFAANAGLYAIEWILLESAGPPVVLALFVHVTALGSIVISGFWSVINERFDPHSAKQAMKRIVAGGTLGGIAVERIASHIALPFTLISLAAANVACGLVISQLAVRTRPTLQGPRRSGVRLIRHSSYLRMICAVVLSIAAIEALLDYALKAHAAAHFTEGPALVSFFAAFYVAIGVITFAVQTAGSGAALRKLGLAGTIALVPGSVIILGVLGAAAGRLWSAALARGVESAAANSLFRSAYELLYTPLPGPEKRASKTLIDVALTRLGDATGSILVLLAVTVIPAWAAGASLALAAIGSVGVGLLVLELHRAYVVELADALKRGVVEIDPREIHDATTRRTLVETSVMLDRDRLLSAIQTLRSGDRASGGEGGPSRERREDEVAALLVRLERDPSDDLAVDRLVKLAARTTGQIADALVDPSRPVSFRLRLPRVLLSAEPRRAAFALFVALDDASAELRYECGRALLELRLDKKVEIEIARRRVVEIAVRDLTIAPAPAEVDHALTLLALVYDPVAVRLAARGVFASDPQVRGTALEYLENVLPSEAHRAVKRGLS